MSIAILWPTFALVLLVFAVWLTMFVQRSRHVRRTPRRRSRVVHRARGDVDRSAIDVAAAAFAAPPGVL